MHWLSRMILLTCVTAAVPAFASEQYTITLSNDGEYYSTVPFRRDAATPVPTSNGTGTYSALAFAGPGWVKSYGHLDADFANGLSGGNAGTTRSRAQTDDFVISGPPGSVTGTLHWHVRAALDRFGGFAGNGGHQAHLVATTSVNFVVLNGSVTYSNFNFTGDGALASYASPVVDAPMDIGGSFPVGAPLLVYMYVESDEYTYGNVDVSPAWAECDAGGASDTYAGYGLRLEEVGGQVMSLPEGYTLNSASWGIVNNHFTNTTDVGHDPRPDLRLEFASANPSRGEVRMTLALPHDADVRVVLYDVTGRALRTLLDGRYGAGTQPIEWDGRDEKGGAASAGLYFVRADVDRRQLTRRIVRVR
jgi:hypothetical protein